MTSYSIHIELDDDTVDVLLKKLTKVPAQGAAFMTVQKFCESVSMYVSEGEGVTRYENRIIGEFFFEEGTLHRPGAQFQLEREIDQNFELYLIAMDPEMGRLIQEKGIDKSEIEYGVSLRLISLSDVEGARQSILIRGIMNCKKICPYPISGTRAAH